MNPLHPVLHVNELLLQPFPARRIPAPSLSTAPNEQSHPPAPQRCTLRRGRPPEAGTEPGAPALPRAPAEPREPPWSFPSGRGWPGTGMLCRDAPGPTDGLKGPRVWWHCPWWAPMAPLARSRPAQHVLPLAVCQHQPPVNCTSPGSNKLLFQEEMAFRAPRNTLAVLDGRFPRDFS